MAVTIAQLIVAAICLTPPLCRDCVPPPPPIRVVEFLAATRKRRRKHRPKGNIPRGGRLNETPQPRHHRTEQRECR
jgi:hypothetical protein